eukprot:933306-Rhodomonas_salina.2
MSLFSNCAPAPAASASETRPRTLPEGRGRGGARARGRGARGRGRGEASRRKRDTEPGSTCICPVPWYTSSLNSPLYHAPEDMTRRPSPDRFPSFHAPTYTSLFGYLRAALHPFTPPPLHNFPRGQT